MTRPKRSGGVRTIHAPDQTTLLHQRLLLAALKNVALHPAATAFRPGLGTARNAWPHEGARFLFQCDVTNFFPSTRSGRVRAWFVDCAPRSLTPAWVSLFSAMGPPFRSDDLPPTDVFADEMVRLTTVDGGLPQGAATSPFLSNALNVPLDRRLWRASMALGLVYTRYADDITLSTVRARPHPTEQALASMVAEELAQFGYELNAAKTRVATRGRLEVTDVCVNTKTGISRARKRVLRAIEHRQRLAATSTSSPAPTMAPKRARGLRGYFVGIDQQGGELRAWLAAAQESLHSWSGREELARWARKARDEWPGADRHDLSLFRLVIPGTAPAGLLPTVQSLVLEPVVPAQPTFAFPLPAEVAPALVVDRGPTADDDDEPADEPLDVVAGDGQPDVSAGDGGTPVLAIVRDAWAWVLHPLSPAVPFVHRGTACSTVYDALGVVVGRGTADRRHRLAHAFAVAKGLRETPGVVLDAHLDDILRARHDALFAREDLVRSAQDDPAGRALTRGQEVVVRYPYRRDTVLATRRAPYVKSLAREFARRFGHPVVPSDAPSLADVQHVALRNDATIALASRALENVDPNLRPPDRPDRRRPSWNTERAQRWIANYRKARVAGSHASSSARAKVRAMLMSGEVEQVDHAIGMIEAIDDAAFAGSFLRRIDVYAGHFPSVAVGYGSVLYAKARRQRCPAEIRYEIAVRLLRVAGRLAQIERLDVPAARDIGFVRGLDQLLEVRIDYAYAPSLEPLRGLPRLSAVEIVNGPTWHYETRTHLGRRQPTCDVSVLSELPALQVVRLRGFKDFVGIDALRQRDDITVEMSGVR